MTQKRGETNYENDGNTSAKGGHGGVHQREVHRSNLMTLLSSAFVCSCGPCEYNHEMPQPSAMRLTSSLIVYYHIKLEHPMVIFLGST